MAVMRSGDGVFQPPLQVAVGSSACATHQLTRGCFLFSMLLFCAGQDSDDVLHGGHPVRAGISVPSYGGRGQVGGTATLRVIGPSCCLTLPSPAVGKSPAATLRRLHHQFPSVLHRCRSKIFQLEGGIHKYLDAYKEDGGIWVGVNCRCGAIPSVAIHPSASSANGTSHHRPLIRPLPSCRAGGQELRVRQAVRPRCRDAQRGIPLQRVQAALGQVPGAGQVQVRGWGCLRHYRPYRHVECLAVKHQSFGIGHQHRHLLRRIVTEVVMSPLSLSARCSVCLMEVLLCRDCQKAGADKGHNPKRLCWLCEEAQQLRKTGGAANAARLAADAAAAKAFKAAGGGRHDAEGEGQNSKLTDADHDGGGAGGYIPIESAGSGKAAVSRNLYSRCGTDYGDRAGTQDQMAVVRRERSGSKGSADDDQHDAGAAAAAGSVAGDGGVSGVELQAYRHNYDSGYHKGGRGAAGSSSSVAGSAHAGASAGSDNGWAPKFKKHKFGGAK